MAQPSKAVEFVQAMRGFRTHYLNEQLPEEVTRIEKYAEHRPSFSRPVDIVPVHEREERIAHAEKIEKVTRSLTKNPKWRLTAVQYAAVLAIPLHNLRSATRISDISSFADTTITKIPEIIKYFLKGQLNPEDLAYDLGGNDRDEGSRPTKRKNTSSHTSSQRKKGPQAQQQDDSSDNEDDGDEDDGDENDDDDPTYAPGKPGDHDRSRSQVEKKKCHKRDGYKCILTGGISPDACHIIPFAWNKSLETTLLTGTYVGILENLVPSGDDANPPFPLKNALSSEIRASNKVWNMVDMGPTLHRWWSHGQFALKPLGIYKIDDKHSSVELQFQWMPRSAIKGPKRLITLEDEKTSGKSMLDQLQVDPGVGASRVSNGRPILSGHLFRVTMKTEEAPKFHRMMELQFALIKIAAISGAADAVDLLPDPSSRLEGGEGFKALLWGNEPEEADEPVQHVDLPLREKPQPKQPLRETPFQQPSSPGPSRKSQSQSPSKIQLRVAETQTTRAPMQSLTKKENRPFDADVTITQWLHGVEEGQEEGLDSTD